MKAAQKYASGLTIFAIILLLAAGSGLSAPMIERSVTELREGTIRTVYISTPKVGAKGYIVGDWQKGQVRIEVSQFPQNEKGYEAFLFQIDIKAYMKKMFVGGNADNGIVPAPPAFNEVAGLITKWHSLGSFKADAHGNGHLEYRKGDNLYKAGLNMVFIFGKVTDGDHAEPENVGLLMVECNGPINGTMGSEGMESALSVWPKKQ